MNKYEKKYKITENQETKEFHRSRRMFCIIKNELYIAEACLPYSHAVWFEKEGWMDETNNDFINKVPRGFVDPKGDIYFYAGYDFFINDEVENTLFLHLRGLVNRLNLRQEGKIYGGFIKQNLSDKFTPKKAYGSIKDKL